MKPYAEFDVAALWQALDETRVAKGLSEKEMMYEINELSNTLSIPIHLATVKNMVKRNTTTCQHAMLLMRWLGKAPESFLQTGEQSNVLLPSPATGRLIWNMKALADAVGAEREQQGLTWKQVAEELGCRSSQVSGLHKIKYGISINLAMRITQWLNRPSTDFLVVWK